MTSRRLSIAVLMIGLLTVNPASSSMPPAGLQLQPSVEHIEIQACQGGEVGYPLSIPIRNKRTGQWEEHEVLFREPIAQPEYLLCFWVAMIEGVRHPVHVH